MTDKTKQPLIAFPVGTPLDQVERVMILRTLEATKDDRELTARLLGISVKTLRRKVKQYTSLPER